MLPIILQAAGELAKPSDYGSDTRAFWLGCIGIRKDGAVVSSRNGSIHNMFSNDIVDVKSERSCEYHAEGRALRKMDRGGILYVSRVSRKNKAFAMARPCPLCQARIRAKKIEKVYYSISNNQYGIYYPQRDYDKIFDC